MAKRFLVADGVLKSFPNVTAVPFELLRNCAAL